MTRDELIAYLQTLPEDIEINVMVEVRGSGWDLPYASWRDLDASQLNYIKEAKLLYIGNEV